MAASHRPSAALPAVKLAHQATAMDEQSAALEQLQESHSHPPAIPEASVSQLQQTVGELPARPEQYPVSPGQPASDANKHHSNHSPSTLRSATPDGALRQQTAGKPRAASVSASQLHASSAAVPPPDNPSSADQQEDSLADADQQLQISDAPAALLSTMLHRDAQAQLEKSDMKIEPQLQKPQGRVHPAAEEQEPAAPSVPLSDGQDHAVQLIQQQHSMSPQHLQPLSMPSPAPQPITSPAELAVQLAAQALQPKVTPASAKHALGVSQSETADDQVPVAHGQDILEACVTHTGLDLVSRIEPASLAVPTALAESLASNRIKRVPGGDPLQVCLTAQNQQNDTDKLCSFRLWHTE